MKPDIVPKHVSLHKKWPVISIASLVILMSYETTHHDSIAKFMTSFAVHVVTKIVSNRSVYSCS